VTQQVIQRAGLCVCGQPRVLDVALDQAATFQHPANTRGDLLDQPLQLVRTGGSHMAEHRYAGAIGQIHPVQEQHVEVHVQVQRRAETLHQCHRAGLAGGAGEACLVDEAPRDRPVHDAEHQRQGIRISRQQKPQRVRQRQHPLAQRTLGQHLVGE
jgi:hypothetical protein